MVGMAGFAKRVSGWRRQPEDIVDGARVKSASVKGSSVKNVQQPAASAAYRSRVRPLLPEQVLRVRFWGVRGSYPTVSAAGSAIGGNTTCVEIRYGRRVVVIDCGSGAIPLGEALTREWRDLPPTERHTLTVLFTHAHHDHLCGLPFFAPIFAENADLAFFGPDLAGLRFEEIISGYMRPPYFPVDFRQLPSRRTLTSIGDGAQLIWPNAGHDRHCGQDNAAPVVLASEQRDNTPTDAPTDALVVDVLHTHLHPQNGTLIYRVSADGHSFVFATDVEIGAHGAEADQRFIAFTQGADVLAHDAQYSERDYFGTSTGPDGGDGKSDGKQHTSAHRGFGHSTPGMAAEVARAANVGQLVLFHHNPLYDDSALLALEAAARQRFPNVTTAREGLELHVGAPGMLDALHGQFMDQPPHRQ
ncbi:MAG: MBL fold metallo-hydrolase [Ktedonobacterales bacterium]